MKNTVLATIKKYNMLTKGDSVVIGLSGGADSVSLTAVLSEIAPLYSLKLYAVHLNHGIRGEEAKRDENFAKELCQRLGIEIFVFERDVTKEAAELSMTVEEAGRKIRYELFNEVLNKTGSSKIAVAHNLNDNVETVLMRLCRGTGIRGLGGIAPVRDNIIRPLIEVKRSDIEKYCAAKGLSFCTDSTNLVTDYTRNKVRLELIPWLENNLNPSVCEGINKTSVFMREEDEYLDNTAKTAFKDCAEGENSLSCTKLMKYDIAIRRRVVRLLFTRYVKSLKDISAEHIQAVCALAESKSGSSVSLPYDLTARREFDIIVLQETQPKVQGFRYELELGKPVFVRQMGAFVAVYDKKQDISEKIIYTNCFKCDIIADRLCLRSRLEGDKIYLKGINGNKKIKKLFGDLKIGLEKRDGVPMLAAGSEVLWIGEPVRRTSDKYRCGDGGLYFYIWKKTEETK